MLVKPFVPGNLHEVAVLAVVEAEAKGRFEVLPHCGGGCLGRDPELHEANFVHEPLPQALHRDLKVK